MRSNFELKAEDVEDGISEGQTAIIFEWEDTILASSTLKQYEYLV